jgi:hypothetical protein
MGRPRGSWSPSQPIHLTPFERVGGGSMSKMNGLKQNAGTDSSLVAVTRRV